ncbi:MAG TPA: Hsp20 family protein [Noviherbaspirillum sp.]|jgi:HSP20 family molecular chaperone IbpA|uniref:Hsp20 family protein n=1 Tax=Noviherbaspirillum sp. TaxID=1926288 RepID=UPI002DDCB912|nr:Hsp20 family protein [Noviherbaspirillum sp.]HEV2609370.1 Hsp20 family protein [Noviherbaspirillum sp.]
MARIQQSIEVAVPLHTAYNQLTQFEDYPRFMQDVEQVRQLDDTHLHWHARMGGQDLEWDAEITEQVPDSCIAWRNTSGSLNAGRVEVQPVDQQKTRVILTMEIESGQTMPQLGDPEPELGLRVEQDLARFKEFIESRGGETGEWRGEVHGGAVTNGDDASASRQGSSGPNGSAGQPAQTSDYVAGSEGWDGNEDPGMPVVSSALNVGPRAEGEAEQIAGRQGASDAEDAEYAAAAADYGVQPYGLQQEASTQSEALLSQSSDDSDRNSPFSVAEEVSLDMQTGQARRVGHMPEPDAGITVVTGQDPASAMAQSMTPGANPQERSGSGQGSGSQFQQSIDQAVPLADEPPPQQVRPQSAEQFAQEFGRQSGINPDSRTSQSSARHPSGQDNDQSSDRQAGQLSWFPNLFQAWEEPLVRMRRMREEVEQVFDRFAGRQGARLRQGDDAPVSTWTPALEIAQGKGQVVVSAELPGVRREDVQVEIRNDKLIIEGDRHQEVQREQGGFRRTERSYGHFYRVIALPDGADAEGASASMRDGVLQVTVPLQPTGPTGKRLDIR